MHISSEGREEVLGEGRRREGCREIRAGGREGGRHQGPTQCSVSDMVMHRSTPAVVSILSVFT